MGLGFCGSRLLPALYSRDRLASHPTHLPEPSYSGHSRAYRSGSDGKTVVGVAFPRYRHFFELNSPDSAL
jgi:hypothetical protein